MDVRILDLKRRARDLAGSRAQSAFSLECAEELTHAGDIFFDHPLLLRLQGDALGYLNEACGLGVEHGKRVAMDAAALVLAEPSGLSPDERRRLAVLAEMAGLLHDALRHEDNHAEKGADLCLRILRGYAISPEERLWIAGAVARHEDGDPQPGDAPESARLLAEAVHDADAFRFGPDIFATILWELCECDEWPLERIAGQFPEGLRRARGLADSFRTEGGRRYGPP
ncbi:MAG: hypothetical protein C0405_03345, partial [Desulfovibrio sp.]|nr:hypothetical protein [Desulfovibrio sp.]